MPRRPKPTPTGRPAFEVDPDPQLIAGLREAFGNFMPCDRAWIRVEGELKQISWETSPENHERFCAEYPRMTAEAVLRFLHMHGMIAEQRKPRGRPTRRVGDLNVNEYLAVLVMRDPSVMQLSPRQLEKMTGKVFSASTYRTSTTFRLWQRIRLENAAHAADHARDEIDAGRMSVTAKGRKTVARGDRMTRQERELQRQADAWLADHDVGEESRI